MAGRALFEDEHKRRDRSKKRMNVETLPVAHNALGTKGAKQEFARTEQANFDHLAEELRRLANLWNEKQADLEYLRDNYEDHEEVPSSPQTENILSEQPTWKDAWHASTNVPLVGDTMGLDSHLIWVQPFFCGANMYVDGIRFNTLTSTDQIAGTDPIDPDNRVILGIYAGDGPGNSPRTLLTPPDLEVDSGAGWVYDQSYETLFDPLLLHKGNWYWIAFAVLDPGTFPPEYVFSIPVETYNSSTFDDSELFWTLLWNSDTASPINWLNAAPDEGGGGDTTWLMWGYEHFNYIWQDWTSVGAGNGPGQLPDWLPWEPQFWESGYTDTYQDVNGNWSGPVYIIHFAAPVFKIRVMRP